MATLKLIVCTLALTLIGFSNSAVAIGVPVNDASLVTWLDASQLGLSNGASVASFTDHSGNGNDAVRTTGAVDPVYVSNGLNGKPTVRFDGSNISSTPNAVNVTPYTMFTVSQMEGSQNLRLVSSRTRNWLMGHWGGFSDRFYADGWVHQGPVAAVGGDARVYAAAGDGATSTFSRNGVQLASNAAGVSAPGAVSLGGWGQTGTERSKGDVSEVLLYNRVLTSAERASVNNYLFSKWDINAASGAPVVDGSGAWSNEPFNAGSFPGSKITDGIGNDTGVSYWLGRETTGNEYLVVDLGSDVDIQRLGLQNTRNRGSHDRGTKDFNISVRTDAQGFASGANPGDWSTILSSTLADVRGDVSGLQTVQYNVPATTARYVRFEAETYWGRSSGLNELEVYTNSEFENGGNHALNRPIIAGTGAYLNNPFNQSNGSSNFTAQLVTDGSTSDAFSGNYWLGRQGVQTESFTLDLGGIFDVGRIELTNTSNAQHGDSGTQDFQIFASTMVDGSNNLISPVFILSGTLSDLAGTLPGELLKPDNFGSMDGLVRGEYRYLQFVALNYRDGDVRVGLNEIRVFSTPEPATATFALLGLAGLAMRRRRRAA